MPQLNQKGIAHLFLILILLVAGVALGVYLVQNRTNIFPKASLSGPVSPETSFNLESNVKSVKPGGEFKVDVLVSSDFDAANTFSALISYPADKLEIVGIEPSVVNNTQGFLQSTDMQLAARNNSGFINQVTELADSLYSKAQAQSQNPMPVITAKAYCNGSSPAVELNWAKVATSDLNYLFMKSPDGKSGVMVAAQFDRYQFPIRDTGFISPVRPGVAYTYYLESFSGDKSNSVTVTTPTNCATPTPTPTPTPLPSPSFTPTPTPFPPHSASPNPPAACGLLCGSDSICAGAKDGCTSCLPNNGGQKVCQPPAPSPSPTSPYFITKWVEQKDDKNGTLSLVGSVPNPGFKTTAGKRALMATITFKAKANGEARIDFKGESAIYRNSDNQNILSVSRGLSINIGGVVPSFTPQPSDPECRAIACSLPIGCSYTGGFTSTCNPAEYDKLTCGNLVCPGSPTPSSTPTPKPSAIPTNACDKDKPCPIGYACTQVQCITAPCPNVCLPVPSPSASPLPPEVDGKRADLYKDSRRPNFVNDQDISVFFSKCADKGVELFGQPASVQPICDIFEDGKITVQDWAVLIKFRNKSV